MSSKPNPKVPTARNMSDRVWLTRFESTFGFSVDDLKSWKRLVRLLHEPTDPSSLAATRIMFGFLMLLDIPQERGLAELDLRWGSSTTCHFPLFDVMRPLTLEWMYVVYLIMVLGAIGLMIGFFYRLSCILFVMTYWYVFLLDTTTWNNHSYLYGLIGFLFCVVDASRCWALDACLDKSNRVRQHGSVPLWNYAIMRTQIFLVYFIAGIKKLDGDWLGGYSMKKLSHHVVFCPFRLFISEDQIDYYIVHVSGFLLDLTIGWFMFFDVSRTAAFLICTSFNLMNSQLFKIGMFPFVMIAMMPLFCYPSWPRTVWRFNRKSHSANQVRQSKSHSAIQVRQSKSIRTTWKHSAQVVFCVVYLLGQVFLPFSHFITQGTNHWTEGLYGYSWNMMVHSWRPLHTRVVITDKDSGEKFFLDPTIWVARSRWTRNAKQAKQFAACVRSNVNAVGLRNITLSLDVWISLNDRFQQRFFDPRVDILTANWSLFQRTPWVLPLLSDLSHWRDHIREMPDANKDFEPTYIADYPGLTLENCIGIEHKDVILEVLDGTVEVELTNKRRRILRRREQLKVTSGECHSIRVTSGAPACYFYVADGATNPGLNQIAIPKDDRSNFTIDTSANSQFRMDEYSSNPSKMSEFSWNRLISCLNNTYQKFERSFIMTTNALVTLLRNALEN